jgi:FMN phosphatase YigB (HAD superfamily)
MSSPTQRHLTGERPEWLTFDCYGTLIQWDEGLIAAVERIFARTGSRVSASTFMAVHDRHEHRLEQERPHRSFREVSARAQLEGRIDRVLTAQQAQAYKPSAQIFRHAWKSVGTNPGRLVHICASAHLDLAAARDLGFRAVWVDRGTGRRPLSDYEPNAVVAALDGVLPLFSRAGWL